MRWFVWLVGLAASACYSPSALSGAPCTPTADNCPSDQSCIARPDGFYCSKADPMVDAGSSDGAIPIDGSNLCFGTGLIRDVCFAQLPSGTLSVVANTTIDTATVGGANCTEIRAQAGGPSLCLVVKQTIEVRTGATLRGTGPNPLVLIASASIKVDGTLDVASKRGGNTGAGGRMTCGVGLAGTQGQQNHGGGGGAGGSFGKLGAAGGLGDNMTPAGQPVASAQPTVLIGGCPGGDGGAGTGGGGQGSGGDGGGGVYLIAGSIAVAGTITASGSGGGGGSPGQGSSGAGGGGGSGGLIGFDAPSLAITGSVFANGGGGGGGSGNGGNIAGTPGNDPVAANLAASGGNGGDGGAGNGGSGFGGANIPQKGQNTGSQFCAGGGGGGGAGVVRVFQAPPMTSGMVSPAPT